MSRFVPHKDQSSLQMTRHVHWKGVAAQVKYGGIYRIIFPHYRAAIGWIGTEER